MSQSSNFHPVLVELAWSSQRPELRDAKEDWTGVTNPIERRKLQNRLNQRARRQRKGKEPITRLEGAEASQYGHQIGNAHDDEAASTASNSSTTSPQSQTLAVWRCTTSTPRVQSLMQRFSDHAIESYAKGNPSISHLNLLVRWNVTSALQRNAEMLGMLGEYVKWEGVSTFGNAQAESNILCTQNWPPNLLPTRLQSSTEHHPWIDAFPWPQFRDNMLQAFEHPEICDEDMLCHDVCELANEDQKPTLVVWGPSYDPRSWEVTTEFLQKWGFLLSGCPEIIESTNYWRTKRGERPMLHREVIYAMRLSAARMTH